MSLLTQTLITASIVAHGWNLLATTGHLPASRHNCWMMLTKRAEPLFQEVLLPVFSVLKHKGQVGDISDGWTSL